MVGRSDHASVNSLVRWSRIMPGHGNFDFKAPSLPLLKRKVDFQHKQPNKKTQKKYCTTKKNNMKQEPESRPFEASLKRIIIFLHHVIILPILSTDGTCKPPGLTLQTTFFPAWPWNRHGNGSTPTGAKTVAKPKMATLALWNDCWNWRMRISCFRISRDTAHIRLLSCLLPMR